MRTSAALWPAILHGPIWQNEVVIRDMIDMAEAIDFESTLLVKFVYILFSPGQPIRCDESSVMNDNSGGHDRIHERLKRGFVLSISKNAFGGTSLHVNAACCFARNKYSGVQQSICHVFLC